MKWKWLFILFLSAYHLSAKSQTGMDTDGLNNLNNVYLCALTRYCASLDSLKTQTVYVDASNYVSEMWPKQIDRFKIEYLHNPELIRRLKKGNITFVGLGELRYIKDEFFVSVIPFSASYKKRGIHLANGGGLNVNFSYDPEKKGFTYKSERWSGI